MKGKWFGVSLASLVAVAAAGNLILKPAAESYVAPMVKEQLNNALAGNADYDSLAINWNGTVAIKNLSVQDPQGAQILTSPEVDVSLSLIDAVKYVAFGGTDAMPLISKVTVQSPELHAWENQDTSWNLTRLVKSGESQKSMTFRGMVEVLGGTVYIRLVDGARFTLQEANGSVNFKAYPKLDGALSAKLDGEVISARGSYTNAEGNPFELFVKTSQVNAEYLRHIIPADTQAAITAGTINDVEATVRRDSDGYHLFGSAAANNLAGTYDSWSLTNGALRVSLNDQIISLEQGSGRINDQLVTAAGTVNIREAPYGLNLHVSGKSLAPEKLLPEAGAAGDVDADAVITGTLDSPKVTAQAVIRSLTYGDYALHDGKASVSYENKVVLIPSFSSGINDGSASGNGWYNTETGAYEAYIESNALPLSLAGTLTGEEVSGAASGQIYVKGTTGAGPEQITARLHGSDITVRGISFDTVDAMVSGRDGTYDVPYLNGTMGDGAITAYGTVTNTGGHLNFSGTQVPVSRFSQLAGVSMDGNAELTGTLDGTFADPQMTVQVAMDRGGVKDFHFQNLYADGELRNQTVTVRQAFVQDGHGGYYASGTIGLSGARALDLAVSMDNVRVENTIRPFTDIPATGWIDTSARIGGTINNPTVQGHVHMWDGSIYGKLVTDITADYDYTGETLTLTDITAQAYGAVITGGGRMTGRNLDFAFSGKDVELKPILRGLPGDISGTVDVDGRVSGNLDKPILTGSVEGDQVLVNGEPVTGISGSVYVDPSVVNLQNFTFHDGPGTYRVQGGMRLTDKVLFGQATVEKADIAHLLMITDMKIPNLTGELEGSIDLGGTVNDPDIQIRGEIQNTTVGKEVLGTAQVDADLSHQKLTIRKLEVPVKNGILAAVGTADLNGKADIQIAANDVPIELLTPLSGKELPLSGIFNFTANVSGETKDPRVELSASLDNGTYDGVTLDHLYILATMEDRVITINQAMAERGNYRIKAYGTVPLIAFYKRGLLPQGDRSAMDLTIDMSEADMAALPLLTPWVTEASGPAAGKVHIVGTYSNPQTSGEVTVSQGSLKFKGVNKPLTDINGRVTFSGEKVTFSSTGNMGTGTLKLDGKASLANGTLGSYDASAEMNGLEVDSEYFRGPLTGKFTYAFDGEQPKLSGNLDLANDTINIPLSLETGQGSEPILLDVTVNAGDRVRLYNSMLYDLTITGSAHFGGDTNFPRSSGSFEATRGTLKYLNTRFRVSTAEARFEDGSFLPALKVQANTRLQNYDIEMNLNGTMDHMDLRLTSSPSLTRNQIISLLTFKNGRNMSSNVNSEDVNALITAGLQMTLFGSVEGALQDTLGLDMINISTGSLDPYEPTNSVNAGYYNIEVGKYLFPDFMLTVSQGINYDMTVYGAQYELGRHFGLNGWVNSDDNSYFGARWRYDF